MPSAPQYSLFDIYGKNPWKDIPGKRFADAAGLVPEVNGPFGGGSVQGNDNLVQGLWTVTHEDPEGGTPNQGAQLIPYYGFDLALVLPGAAFLQGGLTPVANSRTSAKFGFTYPVAEIGGPQVFDTVLAVLNPPGDLKQKFIATLGANITNQGGMGDVFKSILTHYMWSFRGQRVNTAGGAAALLTTPLDVAAVAGGQALPFGGLPILLTDGADGNYPVFGSFSDIPRMERAIAAGDFWIPFAFTFPTLLDGSPTIMGLLELAWPHSAAQGGA